MSKIIPPKTSYCEMNYFARSEEMWDTIDSPSRLAFVIAHLLGEEVWEHNGWSETREGTENWENKNLGTFLEALAAWVEDSSGDFTADRLNYQAIADFFAIAFANNRCKE